MAVVAGVSCSRWSRQIAGVTLRYVIERHLTVTPALDKVCRLAFARPNPSFGRCDSLPGGNADLQNVTANTIKWSPCMLGTSGGQQGGHARLTSGFGYSIKRSVSTRSACEIIKWRRQNRPSKRKHGELPINCRLMRPGKICSTESMFGSRSKMGSRMPTTTESNRRKLFGNRSDFRNESRPDTERKA